MSDAPVIVIDGPSASGKGTIASRVARELGFHYLESGALYRVLALLSLRQDSLEEARLAWSLWNPGLRPAFRMSWLCISMRMVQGSGIRIDPS